MIFGVGGLVDEVNFARNAILRYPQAVLLPVLFISLSFFSEIPYLSPLINAGNLLHVCLSVSRERCRPRGPLIIKQMYVLAV